MRLIIIELEHSIICWRVAAKGFPMGVRIHTECVRHGGNCGLSLVDGSVNGVFDGHLNQSICVLNIPHG